MSNVPLYHGNYIGNRNFASEMRFPVMYRHERAEFERFQCRKAHQAFTFSLTLPKNASIIQFFPHFAEKRRCNLLVNAGNGISAPILTADCRKTHTSGDDRGLDCRKTQLLTLLYA